MVTFRLGVNYWPASSAMSWWQRFDPEEFDGDCARIRAAGFDSLRLFLLWEDFQPVPEQVSEVALLRLAVVADSAARHGLALVPTLFTGHMSGVNWAPGWALTEAEGPQRFRVVSGGRVVPAGLRNWYADEQVARAQAVLAGAAAAALRGHAALWAWDLGNENSNCVIPPSRAAACEWLDRMKGAIHGADPAVPITIGLHMEDLEEDRRLGPAEAAAVCDFLCMHGYPMYAPWARHATDELLLPFLGLVTGWLGGKDVLFEEFGAPTAGPGEASRLTGGPHPVQLLAEREAALYTGRGLAALQGTGHMGAMLWCYGDYDRSLWTVPPLDAAEHERHFGLWRADRSPKPALAEIGRWSGRERLDPPDVASWVDIGRDEFYDNAHACLRRLYGRFLETAQLRT